MSEGAGDVEGGLDEPDALQPEPGSLALAAQDDTWARSDWERAAAAVLRKARRLAPDAADDAVWDALTHTTYDGIAVSPLGTADLLDGLATSGRPGRSGAWDIRTPLVVSDPAAANEAVLLDLENGATSVWLTLGQGVDLAATLDGVLLDLAPVVLSAADDRLAAAQALADLLRAWDGTPAAGTNLGGDPLAVAEETRRIADLARELCVLGLVVDATVVHDRGASDAQEVGYALAVGAHALRVLTEHGIEVDEAAGLLEFRLTATDEQFPTIAKLRAARRCWARIVELSGGTAVSQRQHVVTSRPMMSARDPWVNMLRTTVAAFAAGAGGADAITVVPFDSPLGEPDTFGRRIARNTSSLLMSESHVDIVADPAGGAYAVERLTDDLAHAAWAELGRIEEAGGVGSALGDGSLDARITDVVTRRDADVATRRRPITGLTEFPNPTEVLPERPGAGDDVRRWGAAFEALRADPSPSPVFLATMGSVAAHTARAGFAANLLAAGGIPVDVAGATDDVAEVLAAYDGQRVVCLAGPDPAYAAWGAELVAALREAGATWVVLAGKPVDGVDVDDTCATGGNALDFLGRTRERLS